MQQKRIHVWAAITLLLMVSLIIRLAQIQLINTESFSSNHINLIEESVQQRTQTFMLDEGRGRFIDRNGKPITHEYDPSLILFPFLKSVDWPSEKVANIIGTSQKHLEYEVANAEKPFVFTALTEREMNEINELKIPGVFALRKQQEIEDPIADHLIGLIRQNEELLVNRYEEKLKAGMISRHTKTGITGLQSAFDEFLLPEGDSKLLYHVDNLGEPMFGLEVKYTGPANPFYPVAIKTTIDKNIQLMAEGILEDEGIKKGGLVLLDVENSDILAMVSRPAVNPKDPLQGDGAFNQMISPQIPGSVFKIVVAAAAIEKLRLPYSKLFDCDNNLYGDKEIQRPLGLLSFEASFAQSCNYTFAKLAQELQKQDPSILENYANRLGLVKKNGWEGNVFHFESFKHLPEEASGKIWGSESDKYVPKAIAQTAIGQKEVRVTPLALVNMIATIARGGEKRQVRSVTEILYKNGTSLHQFPQQIMEGDFIQPYTAMRLQKMLREVVLSGTGRAFNQLPYAIAGKSGTAQNRNNVNKWFVAYFPYEQPKYALVVVDLDEKETNVKTKSVFQQMVKKLYEYDKQKVSAY